MPIRFLRTALLALIPIIATAADGAAQSWPQRPVRIVIPYAPGGGTDNLVRLLQPHMSAALGQQVVIENKPGASSTIGTEIAARAPADGYTFLATDSAVLVNPGLLKNMPYDTLRQFVGLTMMARAPVILVAHASVPAKSLKELLELARAKPGALTYASGGNGTSTHLAAELMKLEAKVDILHVPYKGTAPAMNDLLAGQVSMQFAGISAAKPHVEAGKLNAIALTGEGRNAAMPSVPTFEEAGVANVDADTYWGVYAPTGTPPEIVRRLRDIIVEAIRQPATAERATQLGYVPIMNTPDEHDRQMRQMIARWAEVIRTAKIAAD